MLGKMFMRLPCSYTMMRIYHKISIFIFYLNQAYHILQVGIQE